MPRPSRCAGAMLSAERGVARLVVVDVESERALRRGGVARLARVGGGAARGREAGGVVGVLRLRGDDVRHARRVGLRPLLVDLLALLLRPLRLRLARLRRLRCRA